MKFGALAVAILQKFIEDFEQPSLRGKLKSRQIKGELRSESIPHLLSPLFYFIYCSLQWPSVTIFLLFDQLFTFGSLIASR